MIYLHWVLGLKAVSKFGPGWVVVVGGFSGAQGERPDGGEGEAGCFFFLFFLSWLAPAQPRPRNMTYFQLCPTNYI